MISLPLNYCVSQRAGGFNVVNKVGKVHEVPRTVHHFEEEIFGNVSPGVEERRVVGASGISEGAGSLNEPRAHDRLVRMQVNAHVERIVELQGIHTFEDQHIDTPDFDDLIDDVVGVVVIDRD